MSESPRSHSPFSRKNAMPKLTPIVIFTAAAIMLAGCDATAQNDGQAESSPSATAEETPSPEASETPEPTEEPTPEATSEPTEVPEEPVPTIEPLPAGPNDPFVPPPHGEPNPMLPPNQTPVVADDTRPHSDPAYFLNQTIAPVSISSTEVPNLVMPLGGTLTVVGSDYAPGERIYVLLAWPQTGTNYIHEPAIAVADKDGHISFPISISTAIPARDYVVMTMSLDADMTVREAGKRFHNVTFTAQ